MGISQEATWGSLEPLYTTPLGFSRLMGVQVVVYVAESFVWELGMLGLMLLTTDFAASIPPLTVFVVGTLTLLSAVGVGFAFGAVALWNEEIEDGTQIVFLVLFA